tara:strand:+ start:177 stop:455 length:279 start_codon:yes stop_codon:yes gene_type:complete
MNNNDQTLLADGFDDALIGVTFDQKAGMHRVVYDKSKMVDVLCKRDSMTPVEAVEYLDFNTWNAWAGKGTPIYADVMPERQDIEEYLTNYNE